MVRESVDFKEITKSIRHYIPPDPGLDSPYSIDATDTGVSPQVLTGLIHGIEKRNYDPGKCAFYISPETFTQLRYHDELLYVPAGRGNAFKGRPIRTDPTVPDDVVLFIAPDAVSLGGKIYHPGMIAYADLDVGE